MMNEELKPCPFCGMIPKIEQDTVEEYGEKSIVFYVKCSNEFGCDCVPETDNHSSIEDAIKAWNTRYEPTCTMEKVLLYDEECVEGIECDQCGWGEIHDHSEPIPYTHCPNCKAKVEA